MDINFSPEDQTNNTDQMSKYNSFAAAFVNDLFSDISLPQLRSGQDLPGLVIDKASGANTTTDDDTTEEKDILDDMSSLNSSLGSHCRHLFVHNFLVKRRHSADVIHVDNLLDLKTPRESSHTRYQLPLGSRRHSINSLNVDRLNDELVKLDSLRSSFNDLATLTATRMPIIVGEEPAPVQRSKVRLRRQRMAASNGLKKGVLRHVYRENLSSFEDITTQKADRRRRSSGAEDFAGGLVEQAWLEAMEAVVGTVRQVRENFAEGFVEGLIREAGQEVHTLSRTIVASDRFYFRCDCRPMNSASSSSSSLSGNNSSGSGGNNINCLLAIYCMIIALSECHLQNQITFVCCHFG
jgi:hypothetical protein